VLAKFVDLFIFLVNDSSSFRDSLLRFHEFGIESSKLGFRRQLILVGFLLLATFHLTQARDFRSRLLESLLHASRGLTALARLEIVLLEDKVTKFLSLLVEFENLAAKVRLVEDLRSGGRASSRKDLLVELLSFFLGIGWAVRNAELQKVVGFEGLTAGGAS
jgi:hypothetical protein